MASRPAIRQVLLDTGPLVALLRRNDIHHDACANALRVIRPPLLTCWPVVTEAAWRLRDLPRSLQRLYAGPKDGVLRVLSLPDDALTSIGAMAKRYRNLRPQLADLALVHLAEEHDIDTIFTLDRRDFSTFRRRRSKAFRFLPERL